MIWHHLCAMWTDGSVVAGSISSEGNHSIHCWWDLRSKQQTSVSVYCMQVFSDHGNSINKFYFKQLSLAWVQSLSKTFLFQAIQFIQTVLIQTIQFSLSTVSMSKTVLFLTIHFCINTQFSSIGPYQMLPLWARVDLGAIAMKGYFAVPKAPALLEPHHQIV